MQKRERSLQNHHAEAKKITIRFPDFLQFLLEEKQAIEYMEDGMRDSTPQNAMKNKIHSAIGNLDEEFGQENPSDNPTYQLQNQIQENQKAIQKVIEGLVQVTKVMSQPNQSPPATSTQVLFGTQRKKCLFINSDNHKITEFAGFAAQDNKIKVELIKKNGVCFSCLKAGHIARNCSERKHGELRLQDGKNKCEKYYHSTFHMAFVEGFAFDISGQLASKHQNRNRVLLMVNSIRSRNQDINTLWDPDDNVSLISDSAAKRLGLQGSDVDLATTKVGNTTNHIKSKEYILPVTDTEGKVW